MNDANLVERAVRNARRHEHGTGPRWVAVMSVFACGSTTAHDLCRRYGLGPDDVMQGPYQTCPDCGDDVMDENGVCPECS